MIKPITIIILLCTSTFAQYERIEYSPHSDTIAQSNITTSGIDSVFRYISSYNWLIDFDDCNICKSRAYNKPHDRKKFPDVTIAKAWLIADSKRSSQKEIYRYKPIVYLSYPGKCPNWSYHVAPVIITASDTFVIDPATQNKPVKLNKWAAHVIPNNGKGFLIIKDDRFYIYPEVGDDLLQIVFTHGIKNDRSLTDNKYLRAIDETLQAKHGFYEPWKFNYYISLLMELLE